MTAVSDFDRAHSFKHIYDCESHSKCIILSVHQSVQCKSKMLIYLPVCKWYEYVLE